jgi:hypothetical protein
MMRNKPLRDFTDCPIYVAEDNPQEESTSAEGGDIFEGAKKSSDAENGSLGQSEQKSAPAEMDVDSPMEDGDPGGSEADGAEASSKPGGAEDPGAMAVDGMENVPHADGNKATSHKKPLSTIEEGSEGQEELSENLTAIAAEGSSSRGRQAFSNGGKAAEKPAESEESAEDGPPWAKVMTRSRTGAAKPWSFGTSPAGKQSANRRGKGPAQPSQKEGPLQGRSPAKPSRKPMHVGEGGSSQGESSQMPAQKPAQMPVAEEGPSDVQKAVSRGGKGKRPAEQAVQPKKAAKRRRRRR